MLTKPWQATDMEKVNYEWHYKNNNLFQKISFDLFKY